MIMIMSDKTNSMWEFFLMDNNGKSSEKSHQTTLQNETGNKTECKKVCPHFEAFVDFYSFFLLMPFRLKLDHITSEYAIVTSHCRKVSMF